MFQGQRGWFSGSVSHDLRQFWVAEGGTISDPRVADFLFSCDASHPDTLRIYQSLDYIEDNATVFHACYLSAVANAEIKNSVALGHFILPPASLQKEIRRKIGSFIWEQDQHFLIEKYDEVTSNELKAFRESSVLATDHKKELSESTEKHFIRTPVVEKQMYFPLQHYPVNNMVTGAVAAVAAVAAAAWLVAAPPQGQGKAGTQSPTTINYTVEFPLFEEMAEVNTPECNG
ncbi:telomere repeats-binding bouquet formation protein 2 isoform X1 [Cervus elaphus]|uniref:telomere repeats-binding bouquet formation protein 2 isoform X1 n=1 Tax=Cervus elaphus TaxID=9860 RepID=UPI001CC27B5F|nr:telomere repeats-binding bouquet formation protein 2 isoform X1 [Cervus elaphus]XP_043775026.1 telomere repeats-binding bouquet formation protein 2 isoform X1 [Cervus elaphus]XP_043775027.1 telomere repeats-binding bouquet formation protein 2 isoform X1 [Cervus elaphus]XP_043775028.1 telomere repeats-binding bouquet formation protein 2 isoform X1 [Cervus elaphus]XP_043775030.1 telomere repeats-binding bouquet formation protein 2 isoform X1 [Cervus elaphus]XP_043775031.1 telomere repeats-bin